MTTKICSKCDKDLPLDNYYTILNKRGKSYTYTYCRKCHYQKMTKHTSAQWRKDNPKKWSKAAYKALYAWYGRMNKGVYLLITTKGLYVGASDKIRARVMQHNGNQPGNVQAKGAKVITWFTLEKVSNRKERFAAEQKWIKRLRPALNEKTGPKSK